jgi:predicted nucleotidyltransferase
MNRENAVPQLHFVSTSSASDGSFVAIAEIGALLGDEPHRLIGGVAVVLHQYRLGIDHPIRATADADFGVPPYALKDDSLVDSVASLGYQRASGNRWVRALPGRRSATVDLLVPSYRTRLRSSVQHGSTNTIEVGGLAEALQRDPVPVSATVALTDGEVIALGVLLPDLASLLALKLHARRVRQVDRDEARRLGITVLTSDEFATSIALRNPHALIRAVQRVPADRFERYVRILSDELPEAMRIVAPMLLD